MIYLRAATALKTSAKVVFFTHSTNCLMLFFRRKYDFSTYETQEGEFLRIFVQQLRSDRSEIPSIG